MAKIETVMTYIVAVGIMTRDNFATAHKVSGNKITTNEGIIMTKTSIDIFHHFSRVMNDTEIISKQFLGLTMKLVNTSSVFDCVTIANPIEIFAPKVTTIMSNTSAITSNIAYTRVIIHL